MDRYSKNHQTETAGINLMKSFTKMIVSVTVLSCVGVGFWVKNTYAVPNNIPSLIAQVKDPESDDAKEAQEMIQLQRLAKISLQQAQQIAEKAVGGQAHQVELDNDQGNLVYNVEIGQKEVAVDAGNGRVLYVEQANQEDDSKTEASRPRSSIQVTPSPEDDHE